MKLDKSSIAGVLLAAGGIFGGMMMEGGRVGQILQPTAAMIVLGGTLGALMIAFPVQVVLSSLKHLARVFLNPAVDHQGVIAMMTGFCAKARRDGVLSLDSQLSKIDDRFLRRAMMLAIDGTPARELRKAMEIELDLQAERDEEIPRVFESAGGYSPTVGIIGAVLGLIQVMQHLDNIEEVGKGIAVAFVATIYGVALANLVCLPAAGKLKIRMREEQIRKEMMLEGVISMLEGSNPRMLEIKLAGFLEESTGSAASGKREADHAQEAA